MKSILMLELLHIPFVGRWLHDYFSRSSAWELDDVESRAFNALKDQFESHDPVAPERGWLSPTLAKAADRVERMQSWMKRP
jgi:hypothetical protein